MDKIALASIPKLLDISVALFISVAFNVMLGYVGWKLWQAGQAKDVVHSVEKAELNTKIQNDSEKHAAAEREGREQTKGMVDGLNLVLKTVHGDQKVMMAIASKVGVSLKDIS